MVAGARARRSRLKRSTPCSFDVFHQRHCTASFVLHCVSFVDPDLIESAGMTRVSRRRWWRRLKCQSLCLLRLAHRPIPWSTRTMPSPMATTPNSARQQQMRSRMRGQLKTLFGEYARLMSMSFQRGHQVRQVMVTRLERNGMSGELRSVSTR